MIDHYQVTLHFRGGETERGYKPEIDAAQRVVRYAPRANAPRSASAFLSDLLTLRFVAHAPAPALELVPKGKRVRVRLASGQVVVGQSRALPIPGGVWLEVPGAIHELVLCVESAIEAVEMIEGMPREHESMIPPPFASAAPAGPAWMEGKTKKHEGSLLRRDPFEAPTVGEFNAIDLSKLKG